MDKKTATYTVSAVSFARSPAFEGDEYLDDAPLQALVGRSYQTWEGVGVAVGKFARRTQDPRCGKHRLVAVQFASGERCGIVAHDCARR